MTACYALYKGDEFIDMGSIGYLAKILGVSEKTVRYYRSPAYQRKGGGAKGNRMIVIRVEGE